jgi:hypothetical protein
MQIGVWDLVRTFAEHLRQAGRDALAVPLVTPVTRVSAGQVSIVPRRSRPAAGARARAVALETMDGWEPIARLPPTKYRTVQQTPLGEWPLEAAEVEARGHEPDGIRCNQVPHAPIPLPGSRLR